MEQNTATTEELANATENVLNESEWVIDGVPAEIQEVGQTVNGDIDIRTNAGMYTETEWHRKMMNGDIQKVN